MPNPYSIGCMQCRFEPLITRNSAVVETLVGSEKVLMLADSGLCFPLGELGSRVWNQLSESAMAATLIEHLREIYEAPRGVIERDVHELLAVWSNCGLITLKHAAPHIFHGSGESADQPGSSAAKLIVVDSPAA